jgi:N-acetylneuraminic acid mutarotase
MFWEYDPASNVWTRKADFPGSPRYDAAGFSISGKGYLGTGGLNASSSTYCKDFWEYDPVTDHWTQKADFGGGKRFESIGLAIGNKGYFGLGLDSVTFHKDFWEYDPTINSWTQKSNFPTGPRIAAVACFAIGSYGYFGLGNAGRIYRDFWEYNQTTNNWVRKADFGGIARTEAVGFSIGLKGYIGTGLDSMNSPLSDLWEYTPDSVTGIAVAEAPSFSIQTYPNPFIDLTTFHYVIPNSYSKARVIISDMQGKVLKEIILTEKGEGFFLLNTTSFAFGMYLYALYLDDKEVYSGRMTRSGQ